MEQNKLKNSERLKLREELEAKNMNRFLRDLLMAIVSAVMLYLVYRGWTHITSAQFYMKMPLVTKSCTIAFGALAVILFIWNFIKNGRKFRFTYFTGYAVAAAIGFLFLYLYNLHAIRYIALAIAVYFVISLVLLFYRGSKIK